jgi:catechol 2,3-dioxygenase-like lactoylglutathione lyase family enzyme
VITGIHTIVSTTDVGKTRAFFRDVLGLPSVDAGRGWLIFALPPAELAAHPDDSGGKHELYLMCDDIEGTMAALSKKGVRFTRPVADRGWGLLTSLQLPGAGELWLYEPKHPVAIEAPKPARRAKPAGRSGGGRTTKKRPKRRGR